MTTIPQSTAQPSTTPQSPAPRSTATQSASARSASTRSASTRSEIGTAPKRRGRPGYSADEILAVAVRVFTERGYEGATMSDLAAALGITKSTIYHHVSGKKAILASALNSALDALEQAVDDARASDRPAVERLETLVRQSIAVLVADLPSVTLLLRVRGNTDVEQAALARRRRIDAEFAALVTQAQVDGALRSDLDPALVARLVFGTVNSLVEWYRPRRDAIASTEAAPAVASEAASVALASAALASAEAETICDAVCAMVFGGLRAR